MAELINMPRLSDTMEEGTVAKWYKKVGDSVIEGDILAEIETDKATMEFESFQEGELLYIGIQEGGTAPVDSLLAIIGEKGEDISGMIAGDESPADEKEVKTEAVAEENATVTVPSGVEVITMPRLSDTMEEGTVAKWNIKVGDTVAEGDILAEIETDKATMEFESFYTGTLLHIGLEEGQSAPVDAILAVIGDKDTDKEAVKAALFSMSEADVKPEVIKETPHVVSTPEAVAVPKPAPVVQAPKVNSNASGRILASPLAKKLAEEKGINLNNVAGSGEGGRIIKRDIDNFNGAPNGSSVKSFVPAGVEGVTEFTNSSMRKVIAKRLSASKFSAPHYYLGVEFDMDNAIAFRQQYNTVPDTKISFNDIIVKAVALALKQHPQVNSQWFDDKIIQNHRNR